MIATRASTARTVGAKALPSLPCRDNRTFEFESATTALLVIDMQRDFLESAVEPDPDRARLASAMPRVAQALAAGRAAGLAIVHTREGYAADGADVNAVKRALGYVGRPGPNGPFLVRDSKGHDFMEGFAPEPGEEVIDKAGFSAFYGTDLEARLRGKGVTHLVLTGVTVQCCVHSTLRDAVERGFFCLTLEDATAAVEPGLREAVFKIIQAEGHLFGWIGTTTDFCGTLDV